MRRRGFSLAEMMVVLALFAILAGLAHVQWTLFSENMTRAEVDALHATCMYAQRYAQATREPVVISLDTDGHAYGFRKYRHTLGTATRFGCMSGLYGPPSAPAVLLTDSVTFTNRCITMWPHGIIQAGAVYLVDATKQHQYALSCGVSSVSYLRTYRYDGGWQPIT